MKKGLKIVVFSFVALAIIPLVMFVLWLIKIPQTRQVVILDKTVLNSEAQEHSSFWWYAVNNKWVKPSGELYDLSTDYYGFFPKQDFKYEIRDLNQFNSAEKIDSLADNTDWYYINDAYGIYEAEWLNQTEQTKRSKKIYGGLSKWDVAFASAMKEQGKLVIAEFNCFASPAFYQVRRDFEDLYQIRWNGWTGRYFESLDTAINKEIPKWLIYGYLEQHNEVWPFKSSGIAFIHEDERIEILENKVHLNEELPHIFLAPNSTIPQLPRSIGYPFWFDQVQTSTNNNVPAFYKLNTTYKGDSILNKHGILKSFPAVIAHPRNLDEPYAFYYLSGDFSDNPINKSMAKFEGIEYMWPMITGNAQRERNTFFWRFYLPLLDHIFEQEE